MIREFQTSDTEQVMKIWLSGNEDAHPFVPDGYWRSHFHEVQKALLQSKVFVYVTDEKILGFLGMIDNYIAGIFVAKNCRSLIYFLLHLYHYRIHVGILLILACHQRIAVI